MALSWFGGSKQASLGDLIAARKYTRAIEVLRAQFRGGARDPRLRLQLADVLVLAGRAREATPILSALADEYAREGFAAKAIAVLKKLQKVAPGQADVERRLAELLHGRLRPADAPARPPAAAGFEPAGFEFGMEEIGSEDAGEIAVEATASPSAPPVVAEEEFFDTLQDIVEAGESAAAAEALAPSPASAAAPQVPSPLFGGFSEDELRAVISRLRLLSFEPGDIVVTEGQPGDSLFVLTTGALKAFVRDQTGRNVPVRDMPEGSFFGEISMLCEQPRSATVTCATHCELLALDRAAFDEIVAVHPHVRQVVQETYETRAGSLEEMLARDGWDGTPPKAPQESETPAR
jgi:CRP-like cAMP-binding protein